MANVLAESRDVAFVLFEQLKLEELFRHDKFSFFDTSTISLVLREAEKLAENVLFATAEEGDRDGCSYQTGRVEVPEVFQQAYRHTVDGGWIAMTESPEQGGQGLPHAVASAANELFAGANTALFIYAQLCHGVGNLVLNLGTEKQQALYLDKLFTGAWGGTMCLTEPGAGSDVGAVRTKAVPNEDGSYSIIGDKIFITAAEQNLTDNIVHAVLARIEGAPKGTSGISMFLVPKVRVKDDGTLGDSNGVYCTGIEEKLGLHGSATCRITFGDKAECRGELLGGVNRGMAGMFLMMNEERLNIGSQSLGTASAAYLAALRYARERVQGKDLTQMADPDARPVAIAKHPDVRRMLLWMKSHVEGMRSLNYFTSLCMDRASVAATDQERQFHHGLVELLTPICKAYCSERAFEVCVQAMQVLGGYGYCADYPIERMLRDCKIASIYEGANGIQAMDLVGRKIGMQKMQVFNGLLERIRETVATAKGNPELENAAAQLEVAIDRLSETALFLLKKAGSPDVNVAFSHAASLTEALGDVVLGWLLLWRALTAAPALREKLAGAQSARDKRERLESNPEAAFYHGQIVSACYFISSVLPGALGRMAAVCNFNAGTQDMVDAGFGT